MIITMLPQNLKVSPEDLDLLEYYKWYITNKGYLMSCGSINGKQRLLHRLIGARLGFKEEHHVDHINGDRLDNRRDNLRPVSNSQNAANRRLSNRSVTGFKGVRIFRDKFQAVAWKDGKPYYLGTFENALDAAKAYDTKMVELFGDFALTNAKLGIIDNI